MTTRVCDLETDFQFRLDNKGEKFTDFGSPYNNGNKVVLTGCYDATNGYQQTTPEKAIEGVTTLIGHNIKYDALWLKQHGLNLANVRFKDTLLRAAILSGGTEKYEQLSLGHQAATKLGTKKPDIVKKFWDKGVTTSNVPRSVVEYYLKTDVSNTAFLYNYQLKHPLYASQKPVIDFCESIIPVLTYMEDNGIYICPEAQKESEKELIKLQDDAERALYELLLQGCKGYEEEVVFTSGKTKPVDSAQKMSRFIYSLALLPEKRDEWKRFASRWKPYKQGAQKELDYAISQCMEQLPYGLRVKPKASWMRGAQVVKGLYLGATGLLANSKMMHALLEDGAPNKRQKAFIEAFLNYSKYKSWLNTNFYGTTKYIADDGFVHGDFNQTGTVTLRLSCSAPNLQNIPARDKQMPLKSSIRSRFKDGYILGADYGQLEFRIVGELSGDAKLIQDVVNGVDIHTQTAKLAFGMPAHIKDASEMDDEQKALRQRAKTKTFQFQYGAMPKTDVDQKIYDAFYGNYSILAGWQERMAATVAQTQKYTCPITGKVFMFPDATWANKGSWITKLKNYGTQYLASMVTQAAMRLVWEQIHDRDDMMLILQVHDSLVLDIKREALDEAAKIVSHCMLNVGEMFKKHFDYELKVPLAVDMEYGISYTLDNEYKLKENK